MEQRNEESYDGTLRDTPDSERTETTGELTETDADLMGTAAEPRLLDPRVRTYWWVSGGLWATFLGAVLLIVDLGLFVPRLVPSGWPRGLVAAGGMSLLALWAALAPPIAYRRWRFALRERDLWIRRGILIRSVSVIPFRRLQFVDTQQGPLARLFGLSELVVHTAAPGTAGRVPGLDAAEAEILRERLAHLEPDDDEPT